MGEPQQKRTEIRVENIMTSEVFAIPLSMTVREAIKLLISNRISGAPVVDSMNHVVSVMTEGDGLKLAAVYGLDKQIAVCADRLPKQNKLITAKITDSFTDVYKTFLSYPVHRVVVVDDNGNLKGIVSRSNVLRVLVESDAPVTAAPTKEQKTS